MKLIYRFLFALVAALSIVIPPAGAQQPATEARIDDAKIPIESLLRPDGTINPDHFERGSVDLRGWRVTLGINGEPRFVRDPDGVGDASAKDHGAGLMTQVEGDEAWDGRFGPPGINGPVYALALVGNDLYVGGAFSIAGNAIANNLARWDGTTWSSVGDDGVSGPVYCLTVDGNDMFIGGQFLSGGGASSKCILRIDLTTRRYFPMGAGVWGHFQIRTNLPLARVHSIAVKGNDVYVAGYFHEAGAAVRANGIAKTDRTGSTWSDVPGLIPNGGLPTVPVYALAFIGDDLYAGGGFAGGLRRLRAGTWSQPLGGGTNDTVCAITPGVGALYVGGYFTRAGNEDASRVARIDLATETWSPLASGFDGPVFAIAIDGDVVYAGGLFTSAGFVRVNAIARLTDGGWIPLAGGVVDSAGSSIRTILPVTDGLYAGGRFKIAGRATAHNIAFWNGDVWRPVIGDLPSGTDRNGVDGPVYALAVRGSDVFVGGDFSRAGGEPAARVARWNGEEWSALGSGIGGADALVRAIAIDSSGSVYVGGIFSSAGGVAVNGIARWNGGVWSAVGSGIGGTNPYVFALAVQGGSLVAGGAFTTAGGAPANRVARFDIATSQWTPLAEGVSSDSAVYAYVAAIAVERNSIYVGGSFTAAGGVRAANVAKFDGSVWSAMGPASRPGVNAPVATIHATPDTVFVGGTFNRAGSDSIRYLAAFASGRWSALGGAMSAPVTSIARGTRGEIVVGGEFSRIGSTPFGFIARWDGSRFVNLLGGTNGPVRALAAGEAGVYAGGEFTLANGVKANNVSLFDYVGWTSLGSDPASGLIGIVLAAAIDSGDVYIGGMFSSAGGVRASGVARWDGKSWRPLGKGVDGAVRAIAIRGDEVYVVGEFRNAGGIERHGIARWSRSARRWNDVGGGFEGNGPFGFALAVRGDDIIVGGSFTRAGGVDGTLRIARWNTIAQQWSDIAGGISGSGYYTYVSAIAIDSSGRFYAGGIFPVAGGVRANNIAIYDGASWSALGNGVDNAVYDIAITNNNVVYATGEFLRAGDVRLRRVARWDANTWSSLGSGDGFDRRVYSLAVHRGVLYAAGEFLSVDEQEAHGVARWMGDRWLGLGTGVTNPYQFSGAYALAIDDSAIYVGGNFTIAGRRPSYYFARWIPSRLTSSLASPLSAHRSSTRSLRDIVPNPSTDESIVRFVLSAASHVRIDLFALDGRMVASIADEHLDAGEHERMIPSAVLSPGTYLCRMGANDSVESMLMQVVH